MADKYGFRQKKLMSKTYQYLLESSNSCLPVEDSVTNSVTDLYVQTVGKYTVTRKICCVIAGWSVAKNLSFSVYTVLIKPLRKGTYFSI
jgi:hypothetical protein